MTQRIVLRSLEELGDFAGLLVADDRPSNERALLPVPVQRSPELNLDALGEAVSRAAEELRELVESDARARREAEQALARYRRLQCEATRLERVATETQALAERASLLAERAFDPACRSKAEEVATLVATVATTARSRLASLSSEIAGLLVRQDVVRLLTEERGREEVARREGEERQREARLREEILRAEALAREGKFDEALRLLGSLAKANPNSPALASFTANVRRRAWAVKTIKVEKALREARRLLRREPREALALLVPLDLGDMPVPLVRQVYGCWLQACRRLEVEGMVHYSPSFGRGAVLVPVDDGRLEVLSAIGLRHWKSGCRFSAAALKGARPL